MDCGRRAGEVYLVFRNETRRHQLPDRSALTQLAAVRRMFIDCFPDRLTPTWFDNCHNRIYVLDHASRHFYELDDIRYINIRSRVYPRGGGARRQTANLPPAIKIPGREYLFI